MRRLIPFVSLVLCGVSYALDLDISISALRHDPSGVLSYKGGVINLKEALGLGQETKPYARLRFEHGLPILPNLYFQYMPMKFEGFNRIPYSITYGNVTFQSNVDISTEIKLDHYDVGVYWNLWFIRSITRNFLKPEFGVNARVIDFEGKLSGREAMTGIQITESKPVTVPVPMVYGGLAINIPIVPIALRGEVRGVPVSKAKYYDLISVSEIKYYDLTGELRIKPVKPVYVSIGYRQEKFKVNVSDVFTDIKVKGPFALLGAEF